MPMTNTIAKTRIAREIGAAEAALNDALLMQSQLFATMLVARRDTGVDPFTGQDALMRLAKSQQSLLTAGGDLARVHGRLLDINRETGGVVEDCPDLLFAASQDEAIAA